MPPALEFCYIKTWVFELELCLVFLTRKRPSFLKLIPLDRTVLYSADGYPNRFWSSPKNSTEWSLFMKELVAGGNAISELMLQALAPSLPGAHLGRFPLSAQT